MTWLAVKLRTGGWRWVRWSVETLAVGLLVLGALATHDSSCAHSDCGPSVSWAIVVIVAALVAGVEGAMVATTRGDGLARRKRCPECAEPVRAEAKRCKHCGHQFA